MGVFSSLRTFPLSLLLLSVGVLTAAAGVACESTQGTRSPGVAQDDPFVWPEPGTTVYHRLRSDVWRPIIGDRNWQENVVDDPNNTPVEDPALFQEVASAFQEFPFYWLGLEFEGLPLSSITRSYRPHLSPPEDEIDLQYGTCQPPRGEGGCRVPVQIRITACRFRPTVPHLNDDGVFDVRGAPAMSGGEGVIRLWTDDVFIRISALSTDQALAAAEALVVANGQGPAIVREPLPSPVNCS